MKNDLISRKAMIQAVDNTDWYHINRNGDLVEGANSDNDTPLYKAEDVYRALENVPAVYAIPVPCMVGDTVYPLNADRRFRAFIERIEITAAGLAFEWGQYDVGVDTVECWDDGLFTTDDIGKTVFLDETEYLIALKECEGVMTQKITLCFENGLCKLVGASFGHYVYQTQVKGVINLAQNVVLVFPAEIDRISSSFVQGFFEEIVAEIGVAGVKKQIAFNSSIEDLKEFVLENLE